MNGLVLLSSPQWASLHLSRRCGLWRQRSESVYVRGGCHLAVTQSAKCNITTVVGLCGLSVCSVPLWREGLALFSIFPLSPPDTQHFSFIEHLTCLYRNPDASSTLAPMEGAAAGPGASHQPGWHTWTTGIQMFLTFSLAFFPFTHSLTIKKWLKLHSSPSLGY